MKRSESQTLFYRTPAEYFNEALPLGNGKLGAMVYGKAEREQIGLNYDELWSGIPRACDDECITDALAQADAMLLEGKCAEAEAFLLEKVGKRDSEDYLPFGTLYLDFPRQSVTDYERALSLSEAVHRVSYRADGVLYERECFISAPDKVMVIRLRAEQKVMSFAASFTSPMRYRLSREGASLVFDGECFSYAQRERQNHNMPHYSEEEARRGIRYRGVLRAVSDGTVRVTEKRLTVENASEAILVFAAESSFNGFDKHPRLEGKEYRQTPHTLAENALKKGYEALLASHVADYKPLYDRTDFSLDFSETDMPTDERLQRMAQGGETDKGLFGLLFSYAKYLTIAASREGSEAMNLQGIWNHSAEPAWGSNYTTNINTQMNYFPTLTLGLFSCYEPLLRMVKELAKTGKETAKAMYGARGFTAHHNVDIWRKSTPATGKLRWSFFPQAAAWLVSTGYEYYRYTNHTEELKTDYFPIMEESAAFLLDLLRKTESGEYIVSPATSPENNYMANGAPISISHTTAMAMDITAELFDNLLDAAVRCQISSPVVEEVKNVRPHLLPPRVQANGELMEWYDERELQDPHHRHISHLYALYPAHLISPRKTPALADACVRALDARGDDGTGWSLAWKICCRARLGDGEHAQTLLKMQLRPVAGDVFACVMRGGIYPNFLDAHPPFQIDGNFGSAAGICEMLLQWDENAVYLLPALPEEWLKKGSFRGLCTPHGCVSCSWENGKITALDLSDLSPTVSVWTFGEKVR